MSLLLAFIPVVSEVYVGLTGTTASGTVGTVTRSMSTGVKIYANNAKIGQFWNINYVPNSWFENAVVGQPLPGWEFPTEFGLSYEITGVGTSAGGLHYIDLRVYGICNNTADYSGFRVVVPVATLPYIEYQQIHLMINYTGGIFALGHEVTSFDTNKLVASSWGGGGDSGNIDTRQSGTSPTMFGGNSQHIDGNIPGYVRIGLSTFLTPNAVVDSTVRIAAPRVALLTSPNVYTYADSQLPVAATVLGYSNSNASVTLTGTTTSVTPRGFANPATPPTVVTLSGVSSTPSVGTITPPVSSNVNVTISGTSVVADVNLNYMDPGYGDPGYALNFLVPGVQKNITGTSATITVGSVSVPGASSVTLSGVSSTNTVGSLATSYEIFTTVTSTTGTGTVGSVSRSITSNSNITSTTSIGQIGNVSTTQVVGTSITSTSATSSVWNVSASQALSVNINSTGSTSSVGNVSGALSAEKSISAVTSSFNVSSVTVQQSANKTLTGVTASVAQSEELVSQAVVISLTGVSNSNTVNSFANILASSSGSVNLTGVTAISTAGNVANVGQSVWASISSNYLVITNNLGRTNLVPNSTLQGAVVGIIGSTGSLPTGWYAPLMTGMTIEVVSIGTLGDGNSYLDFRVSGTNNGGGTYHLDIDMVPSGNIPALVGYQYTGSVYVGLIAGSFTNTTSTSVHVYDANSSGGWIGSSSTSYTAGLSRYSVSRTLGTSGTRQARLLIGIKVAPGLSADLTIRISAPQMERGLVQTAYIPTYGTSYSADAVTNTKSVTGTSSSLSVGTLGVSQTSGVSVSYTTAVGVAKLSENTNLVPNSMMVGATASTMPVGWNIGLVSGVSTNVVGIGVDVYPYIDIRMVGTNPATTEYPSIIPDSFNPLIPVSQGQTMSAAVDFKLIAGANAKLQLSIRQNRGAGYLSNNSTAALTVNGTWQRFTHTTTLNSNGVTSSGLWIIRTNTPNEVIDFTVRIRAPQLQYGNVTNFIPTYGSSFTPEVVTNTISISGVTGVSSVGILNNSINIGINRVRGLLFSNLGNTNLVYNSTMQGASIGVFPPGYMQNESGGVNKAIASLVGVGTTAGGHNYIDINVSGTNSSGATQYPQFFINGGGGIPAIQGQVFTARIYGEVIAGSFSGFNETSLRFYFGEASSPFTTTSFNIDNTGASGSVTVNGSGSTYVRGFVSLTIQTGNTVDITYRIYAPQIVLGNAITAYIPTYGSVYSAEAVTLNKGITTNTANSTIGSLSTQQATGVVLSGVTANGTIQGISGSGTSTASVNLTAVSNSNTVGGISVAQVAGKSLTGITTVVNTNIGRTNLLLQSNNLGVSPWFTSRITIEPYTAPNGSAAFKLINTGVTDPLLGQSVIVGKLGGRTYTFQAILWTDPGQPTEATLYIYNAGITDVGQYVLVLTTTPTLYTFTKTFASNLTDTYLQARIDNVNAGTAGAYLYAQKAQLEESATASQYIETTTAQVTVGTASIIVGISGNSAAATTNNVSATMGVGLTNNFAVVSGTLGKTNLINNSTMQGAVTGTPGSMPTSWAGTFTSVGLTRQLVASGIDAVTGFQYIDIRLSGTVGGTGIQSTNFDPLGNIIPAVEGNTYIHSAYFGLAAGSWPTGTVNLGLIYRNAAGTAIRGAASSIKVVPNSTLVRISKFDTCVNAPTTRYVQPTIRADLNAGETVDFTIRIAAPQMEVGSIATAYVPTYGSSYSANAITIKVDEQGNQITSSTSNIQTNQTVSRTISGNTLASTQGDENTASSADKAITATTTTVNVGTVSANSSINVSLVGHIAAGFVNSASGTNSRNISLAGNASSASINSLTNGIGVGIAANSSNTTLSNLSTTQSITRNITGNTSTFSIANLPTGISVNMLGISSTSNAGSIIPRIRVTLTNNVLTSSINSISAAVYNDVELSGNTLTGILSNLSVLSSSVDYPTIYKTSQTAYIVRTDQVSSISIETLYNYISTFEPMTYVHLDTSINYIDSSNDSNFITEVDMDNLAGVG